MSQSVIVTCAVTGGIDTPTMSPGPPITPEEITGAATGAAGAGASIIQRHPRRPENGRPVYRSKTFMQILPVISENCDAVTNISSGGNLPVGPEDSLYIGRGELARCNADQLNKIREIIAEPGLAVATPAGARRRLAPRGAGQGDF